MEAIDELISAAQTFYDDARANENGRSRSWEHCYRVFRDARTDPSPDYDHLSLHLAFYLASWGMYRGSSFLLQKDYKWPGLVLWTGCFEGCWLLLVVLCPLARVLVG